MVSSEKESNIIHIKIRRTKKKKYMKKNQLKNSCFSTFKTTFQGILTFSSKKIWVYQNFNERFELGKILEKFKVNHFYIESKCYQIVIIWPN